MSWVSALTALYDANAPWAGEETLWSRGGKVYPLVLAPISHTIVQARIELTLGPEGELLELRTLSKEESPKTLAPVTEDALSRTSTTVAPYPLFDGLKYLAGDFLDFVALDMEPPKKAQKWKVHFEECFSKYSSLLGDWCSSSWSHPKVCAVYQYLSKKTLMRDLIERGIVSVEEQGNASLQQKINGLELPKVVVRFRVRMPSNATPAQILNDPDHIFDSALWLDKTVHRSFMDYYASLPAVEDLCYLSGKITRVSSLHPKKLRNDGDGTKLISANDDENFTYRGRFPSKDKKSGYNEALSVGYESSQKVHNALHWIIRRQGYTRDGLCVVSWESELHELPNFYESSYGILSAKDAGSGSAAPDDDVDECEEEERSTAPETNYYAANAFRMAMDGYTASVNLSSRMVILALDSATPGRLAMTYFKELSTSRYLERVRQWHESCRWRHAFVKDKQVGVYEGMVSLRELAEAVYGTEQNKMLKLHANGDNKMPMLIATFDRLRPCIIDGASIPKDVVRAAVHKASNPLAYEVPFLYNKVLHIACSLVKRSYWEKGVCFEMELDPKNQDRSYLYGRLLAVAESAERRTYDKETTRITQAERYMQAFSQQPFRTWATIRRNLTPYLNALTPGSRSFYKNLFGEITALFAEGEFDAKGALNGKYLLGYDCQRTALRRKQGKAEQEASSQTADEGEREE